MSISAPSTASGNSPAAVAADYLGTSSRPCPHCGGPLHRTGRRPVDRLAGLFVHVRRYRCHKFACQWEGNFRVANSDRKRVEANGAIADDTRKVPASFILHMVIVVLGMGLVLVVSLTEPFATEGSAEEAGLGMLWRYPLPGAGSPAVPENNAAPAGPPANGDAPALQPAFGLAPAASSQ